MKIYRTEFDSYASGVGIDVHKPFEVNAPLSVESEVRPYVVVQYDLEPGKQYILGPDNRIHSVTNDIANLPKIDVTDLQKHLAVRIFDVVANQVMGYGLDKGEVKRAVEAAFLERVLGTVPPWSDSGRYTINDVGVSTGGAFAVPVGFDAKANDFKFFLVKRGDGKWGLPGGYFNITNGEQPVDGFIREFTEEVRDDKNNPIFIPESSTVTTLASGVDTRRDLRVQWHAHFMTLQQTQIRALGEHAERSEQDAAYAAGVKTSTKGESLGGKLLSESELREFLKTAVFTHPHEKATLVKFLDMLSSSKELRTTIQHASVASGPSQTAKYTA